jgi:hemoglobin-like flavoprotein
MIQQGKHLIDALGRIVDGVNAPESVLPIARALALRHVGYGVEARHYIAFATALMRTLRHELAQEFTTSARDAWVSAIELLAQTMMEAAYGANAPQVPNAALRVG